MELKHEIIHEYMEKCNNRLQITLDDDFNVSDNKPDIENVVKEWGEVIIDGIKTGQEKAVVDGMLHFSMLYIGKRESDDRRVPIRMEGKIHFSENVNLSCDAKDAQVSCKAYIEDITIKTINSRKISVKAIVSLNVICEELDNIRVVTGVLDEECSPQILHRDFEYLQMAVNMKDNLRIRESISLPAGKPNIGEIVWDDISLRNVNTRITDEGLGVSGDLNIFLMYIESGEGQSVQWYETTVPFTGNVDVSGCNPDCICYVAAEIRDKSIEPKADYDGEMRDVALEMSLDMDIRAYEECNKQAVEDMYYPCRDLKLTKTGKNLHKLVVRNNSRCRVSGNLKVEDYISMMQIVNSTASVIIDDYTRDKDGLMIYGAVMVNVLYMTSDDTSPMGSVGTVIPFSNKIEYGNCNPENVDYRVIGNVDQLQTSMSGNNQVDIKAAVSLDALIMENMNIEVIDECEVCDVDKEDYAKLPSMVGYMADGRSNLWNVAKRYHTTCDKIRSGNPKAAEHLKDWDMVSKGTKLLLVKCSESI